MKILGFTITLIGFIMFLYYIIEASTETQIIPFMKKSLKGIALLFICLLLGSLIVGVG